MDLLFVFGAFLLQNVPKLDSNYIISLPELIFVNASFNLSMLSISCRDDK